jgi:hypothetical protein
MKDVEIIRKRVLEEFLRRALHHGNLNRLVMISPWISDFRVSLGDGAFNLEKLLSKMIEDRTYFSLVTRKPRELWHAEAVDQILAYKKQAKGRAQIKYNNNLHAKIYIAKLDRFAGCLIGSPNMTGRSLTNDEIGVLVRKTGDNEKFFHDMDVVARDLINAKA